jgi:hypothetical protein
MTGQPKCHAEPFDFAQGKLREAAHRTNEIIHFVQNDSRALFGHALEKGDPNGKQEAD